MTRGTVVALSTNDSEFDSELVALLPTDDGRGLRVDDIFGFGVLKAGAESWCKQHAADDEGWAAGCVSEFRTTCKVEFTSADGNAPWAAKPGYACMRVAVDFDDPVNPPQYKVDVLTGTLDVSPAGLLQMKLSWSVTSETPGTDGGALDVTGTRQ